MKVQKEIKENRFGKPFTVILTRYIYEPDMDGDFPDFLAIVNSTFDKPPPLQPILGGVMYTEIIEGVKSAKVKSK